MQSALDYIVEIDINHDWEMPNWRHLSKDFSFIVIFIIAGMTLRTKQTYKVYFRNQLSRQFNGSRRGRYTTYKFQKLESLGKNNFVHKFFRWND